MSRSMYDGINSLAAGIHALLGEPPLVAGYCDGTYAWDAADWNLFPNAVHVWICTRASTTSKGDVLDVENGDATPAEAPGWINARKKAGLYRPTIYCNKATVPAVRRATGNLVLGKDYDIWCADWTGSAHQVTSSVAGGVTAKCAVTQWRSTDAFDENTVYDDGWPHRTSGPAPKPAPKPAPAPGSDLWPAGVTLREGSTGNAVRALQYALRDCGITGVRGIAADGDYGSQTTTAVRNYQSAEKLSVDGVAGPATRSSLIARGFMTSAGEGK